MSNFGIVKKWDDNKRKFDSYKLGDCVLFDSSNSDLCTYVFYQYIAYNVDRAYVTKDQVISIIEQYQSEVTGKHRNFARNYVLDDNWLSTMIRDYYSVCDGLNRTYRWAMNKAYYELK